MRTPGGVVTIVDQPDSSVPSIHGPDPVWRQRAALLANFPDESSHRKAREGALAPVLGEIHRLEMRVRELEAERPPLIEEAQFYIGKPLPPELRRKVDANDARMTAVKQLLTDRTGEVVRINARYDKELAELEVLWAPPVRR